MFVLDWLLALIAMALLPLGFLLARLLERRSARLHREYTDTVEAANRYLHEVFGGLRTVKSANAERFEEGRWRAWLERHWRIRTQVEVFQDGTAKIIPEFAANLMRAVIVGVGATMVISGQVSIGTIVAFLVYLPRAYTVLQSILGLRLNTQEARAIADELLAVELEPAPHDQRSDLGRATDWKSPGLGVEFDAVSFRFGRGDAGVHDMSFRVEPGEFIGVVGPSGGGKTTIIDLLLGFYSPDSGRVLVGDQISVLSGHMGRVSLSVSFRRTSFCGTTRSSGTSPTPEPRPT